MTTARREIVDVTVTRWYHCISKCVRSAFLMADEHGNDRKQWIEDRLQLLAANFSVSVGGFAAMDNHLHVLCRLDPDAAKDWSAEDVVRRWIAIYPPSELDVDDPKIVKMWVDHQTKDAKRVEIYRERLSNLGWFMKALKEPLSRLCNRADGVKGTFWEARYKSIAILDTEALLATCAYIDLNPVAAGIAEFPERSEHTSIKQRVDHAKDCGKLDALKAARMGSVAGCKAAGNFEEKHWLVPLEDRRQRSGSGAAGVREGMLDSFSLGSYLLLVEYTGRLFRNGKARISEGAQEVLDRLGTSVEYWDDRIKKMLGSRDLRGCCFGCKSEEVVKFAIHRGKRQSNLSPQLSAS
jgi:REP element-mobilizing transposase RayT